MGKLSFSSRNGDLWTAIGSLAGTGLALGLMPLTGGLSAFALPHTLAGVAAVAGSGLAGGILGHALDKEIDRPSDSSDAKAGAAAEEEVDSGSGNGGGEDPIVYGKSAGIGEGLATGKGAGTQQTDNIMAGAGGETGAQSFGFTRPAGSGAAASQLGVNPLRRTDTLGAGALNRAAAATSTLG